MRYLIVNADDFGITKGVSDGIIEAAGYGVVRSTTMLANTEYFDYAVSLLKNNTHIGVGVHLNLTYGRPVLKDTPSLTSKSRSFYREIEFYTVLEEMKPDEIEREFTAQIDRVKAAGITVTHLDTHHHIHRLPKINAIVSELALKYGIGARRLGSLSYGIKTTDGFTDKFHGISATELNFKLLLRKFEAYDSLEMMCHPGYSDLELLNKSGYAKKRTAELAVLSKYELVAYLQRSGIKPVNFGEL